LDVADKAADGETRSSFVVSKLMLKKELADLQQYGVKKARELKITEDDIERLVFGDSGVSHTC
jgi:hypothetical protein